MFVKTKNHRAPVCLVTPNSLKNRTSVMKRVSHDMDSRIFPGNDISIDPNLIGFFQRICQSSRASTLCSGVKNVPRFLASSQNDFANSLLVQILLGIISLHRLAGERPNFLHEVLFWLLDRANFDCRIASISPVIPYRRFSESLLESRTHIWPWKAPLCVSP